MIYKFTDSEQQRIFWTADPHFSHRKIIEYCNRPFASMEEMNEEMIKRWNAKVRRNDIVILNGDFAFGKESIDPSLFLNRLNGKIYLVEGNHDNLERLAIASEKIASFHQILDCTVNGQRIVNCHYPMVTWVGKQNNSWMLFGHTHNSYQSPDDILSYNVGVDLNNYEPISFQEMQAIMAPRLEKFEKRKTLEGIV